MIDKELLDKFDRIQDLPVSEEMLGAYIEGNLSDTDEAVVDTLLLADYDTAEMLGDILSDTPFPADEMLPEEYEAEVCGLFAGYAGKEPFTMPVTTDAEPCCFFDNCENLPDVDDVREIYFSRPDVVTTGNDLYDGSIVMKLWHFHDSQDINNP